MMPYFPRPVRPLLLLLPLLLAACTGVVEKPGPITLDQHLAQAEEAAAEGDHYLASRLYSQLAERSEGKAALGYQIEAAAELYRSGQGGLALQWLEQLHPASAPLQLKRQIVIAQITTKNYPEQALAQLAEPLVALDSPEVPLPLAALFHQARADANNRMGNYLEAAREYIRRARYLTTSEEQSANQEALWQALSQLTDEALRRASAQPHTAPLDGWVALVLLSKEYHLTPAQLEQRLGQWQGRHPDHPATATYVERLRQRSVELTRRPARIAVLLPFSGKFAKATKALKDGILASHYENPQRQQSTLRFYDTAADPQQIETLYRQAVADGAEYVIGPLDREVVRRLARSGELPIPVLALNYAEPTLHDNFYQFSLSPEDEAAEAAEVAWTAGYLNMAVIAPQTALGKRLASAFRQRWEELDGKVVSEAIYHPDKSDYATPLKRMLEINLSEQRRRSLGYLIGERPEFTPRRRQDIDAIFLAAFPRQARLLGPQLRFYQAGDLPIIATSHVYSGHVDRALDRDMDGMLFGDMPWILEPEVQKRINPADRKLLQGHPGQLQRLVAMGIDAYQVLPLLPILERAPYERYLAQTGSLRVTEDRRLARHMLWAKMEHGAPQLYLGKE